MRRKQANKRMKDLDLKPKEMPNKKCEFEIVRHWGESLSDDVKSLN